MRSSRQDRLAAYTNENVLFSPPLPVRGEGRGRERGSGGEGSHQNNNRVKKKSEIRMAIDATTTAAVVERPTPSAPPVV